MLGCITHVHVAYHPYMSRHISSTVESLCALLLLIVCSNPCKSYTCVGGIQSARCYCALTSRVQSSVQQVLAVAVQLLVHDFSSNRFGPHTRIVSTAERSGTAYLPEISIVATCCFHCAACFAR
jgi:hypothetical protein